MKAEHTARLYQDYPELFRGRGKPLTESLMAFGFDCRDGWFDLIDGLCRDHDLVVPEVVQVKEKFGGLRFYTGAADARLLERIDRAEEASLKT